MELLQDFFVVTVLKHSEWAKTAQMLCQVALVGEPSARGPNEFTVNFELRSQIINNAGPLALPDNKSAACFGRATEHNPHRG